MLGAFKKAWACLVDAVDRCDASVVGTPEACEQRQQEVWRKYAEDDRSGQKRAPGTDLRSEGESSSKKPCIAVQTNAQVQQSALAPTSAPARHDAGLGEGAATNNAELQAPSSAAASAASAASDASAETEVVAEKMYEGATLETMPLCEEHAALVKGKVPTMMWTEHFPHWRVGNFRCRQAILRPHGCSTFLMNFTSAAQGSVPVELPHWFSIEELEYMQNIKHRVLCPETMHYGILTTVPGV